MNFLNDTFGAHIDASQVIDEINNKDGAVQNFIDSQQTKVVDLSLAALGLLVQGLSVSCSPSTSSPTARSCGA